MILKLIGKVVYQPSDDKEEVKVETFFYDGFDRTMISDISVKDKEPAFSSNIVDDYTREASERILAVRLFRKEELFRTLYIDFGYSVYLMSDEGKTIERIN